MRMNRKMFRHEYLTLFVVLFVDASLYFLENNNFGFTQLDGGNEADISLIGCAYLCTVQTKCSVFFYKTSESLCNVHTHVIVSPVTPQSNDWMCYGMYNYICFSHLWFTGVNLPA